MIPGSYILVSLDVGGTADPAAIVAGLVSKPDRIVKMKLLHLAVRPPVVTPLAHVEFAQATAVKILEKVGPRAPIRYVVDISNNSGVAFLLAQALPANSLIGVRITAGEQHGAGVIPFLIGDVGGRARSIPTLNLARRQLLLDVGAGFQAGQLSLPLDDPEQAKGVQELRSQMARASLKTTPSGKQVAVVNRGHDDLLVALGMGWAATKLPPPREARASNVQRDAAPNAAGWT